MSEETSPEQAAPAAGPVLPERKRGSARMLIGLLVLLGAWFAATQVYRNTGPPVAWIENDLPAAEKKARETGRRIFLVLHEPGCQVTAANQRNLLEKRFALNRLSKMVCCRVELTPNDPLRTRFDFRGHPLMLVLEPDHPKPLAPPLVGPVDQLQFETYVWPEAGRK